MNLGVNIGEIKLKNPVMVASGTFGYGEEYSKYIDLNKLGAIVVKSITLHPREGNLPPRIVETSAGILNSIGLQNVGVHTFIKEKLQFLKQFKTAIIVNIAGNTVQEFIELVKILNDTSGISGIEINISCPNIKYNTKNHLAFGQNPKLTYKLTKDIRKATKLPLIVKLSPEVTDITVIAKACEDGGADALSLINTFPGMAINIETREPKLANIIGGLSGPAIKPIAIRLVWKVFNAVQLPIIGIGGIFSAEDALEFIIAGATAVAIGTANFVDPEITLKVIDGIKNYLAKHKINNINQLIGSLKIEKEKL
ncbi:MAG: dihydroorotate dehydrogenase [Candidatus Firestonebacteria bacterium]